jgi:hypothetical protein
MDTTDQFILDFEVSDDDDYVLVDVEEEEGGGGGASGGGSGSASGGAAAAPQGGGAGAAARGSGEPERETDPARLAQRQKQIAFGKNTEAYKNYVQLVPK